MTQAVGQAVTRQTLVCSTREDLTPGEKALRAVLSRVERQSEEKRRGVEGAFASRGDRFERAEGSLLRKFGSKFGRHDPSGPHGPVVRAGPSLCMGRAASPNRGRGGVGPPRLSLLLLSDSRVLPALSVVRIPCSGATCT